MKAINLNLSVSRDVLPRREQALVHCSHLVSAHIAPPECLLRRMMHTFHANSSESIASGAVADIIDAGREESDDEEESVEEEQLGDQGNEHLLDEKRDKVSKGRAHRTGLLCGSITFGIVVQFCPAPSLTDLDLLTTTNSPTAAALIFSLRFLILVIHLARTGADRDQELLAKQQHLWRQLAGR